MNGGQDLGGQMGFGPVLPERDEPVFHAAWEKRVLAMSVAAGGMGKIDGPAYGMAKGESRLWAIGRQDLSAQRRQIAAAWRFALSREPRASEVAAAIEHLARQRENLGGNAAHRALASLCHVLLNANEFLYVD